MQGACYERVCSISKRDWRELMPAIAGAGVRGIAVSAEVSHDAPHGIECSLHGAFDPTRCPADVVTGKKDTALFSTELALHEMTEHSVVVAIVARQRAFEGTEEIRICLPAHGDWVADDVRTDIDLRIDFLERAQRQLDAPLDRQR